MEALTVDPLDPRAPAQADWDRMTPEQRRAVVAMLPSEIPRTTLPEGDGHRIPKTRALQSLDEYYRRIGRQVYLGSELPIYYPDEPMFAPDLLAVVDVDPHERDSWVVSQEQRGLDFVMEIHVSGERRKDVQRNVERFARLGIPEYVVYEPRKGRLFGYHFTTADDHRADDHRADDHRVYEPMVPQGGRWHSAVLDLDLTLDQGRLRFFHGSAPLLDAHELVSRLSSMVDDAVRRAEEQARHAEEQARHAEEAMRRANRFAEKLRQLGVDPDSLE